MLIIDREGWRQNAWPRWISFAIGAAAVIYYRHVGAEGDRWPGGSSGVGLVYGGLAAILILFEFAYIFLGRNPWLSRYPKPCFRAHDVLRWHVWVGLFVLTPLAVMHSRLWPLWLRPGAAPLAIPALCSLVFLMVIASGILILILQQFIPRLLRYEAPDESPHGEVPALRTELAEQAWLLVEAAVGPPPDVIRTSWAAPPEPTPDRIAEYGRRVRSGAGAGPLAYLWTWRGDGFRLPLTQTQKEDAVEVWEQFRQHIYPYLAWQPPTLPTIPTGLKGWGKFGKESVILILRIVQIIFNLIILLFMLIKSIIHVVCNCAMAMKKKLWPPRVTPASSTQARNKRQRSRINLASSTQAREWFSNLAGEQARDQKRHPRAAALYTVLEALCDRRRQLDRQARLHCNLHVWLGVHYFLSTALLLLLAWHILTAFKYS